MGEIFINFTIFYDFFSLTLSNFLFYIFQFCQIILKIFDGKSYAKVLSFAFIVLEFPIFPN